MFCCCGLLCVGRGHECCQCHAACKQFSQPVALVSRGISSSVRQDLAKLVYIFFSFCSLCFFLSVPPLSWSWYLCLFWVCWLLNRFKHWWVLPVLHVFCYLCYSSLFVSVGYYTVRHKNRPKFVDRNLKMDYQILIILGMNIPDTTWWPFVSGLFIQKTGKILFFFSKLLSIMSWMVFGVFFVYFNADFMCFAFPR